MGVFAIFFIIAVFCYVVVVYGICVTVLYFFMEYLCLWLYKGVAFADLPALETVQIHPVFMLICILAVGIPYYRYHLQIIDILLFRGGKE